MRLIATNNADSAVLSSTDFVGSLPVTNLQLEGRTRVARTVNTAGNKTINGSWSGGGYLLSAAVLYRHNLSSAATWRLKLFDGPNQTGNLVYDSGDTLAVSAAGWGEFGWGLPPGWGAAAMANWDSPFSVLWFDGVTAASFSIVINDPSNSAGYVQVKRLILGAYIEPEISPTYGMALAQADASKQTRTGGGSIRSENLATWRRMTFTLDALSEGERAGFLDALRQVGLRKEVFVSVWPTNADASSRDYTMLGKFTVMPTQTANQFQRYTQDVTIEEV